MMDDGTSKIRGILTSVMGRHAYKCIRMHMHALVHVRERSRGRERVRKTDRQTGRQTDRQTDRRTESVCV